MVDVICLFPRFIGYGINHLLGNNPDVAASFLNQHVGCFMYIPRSQLESCPEQGAVFRVDVEFTAIIGILDTWTLFKGDYMGKPVIDNSKVAGSVDIDTFLGVRKQKIRQTFD